MTLSGQGNHDFTRPPNLYYPRSPIWPETVPNTTGYGWQTGFKRAKAFVSQLTTEEKSQICTGKGVRVLSTNLDGGLLTSRLPSLRITLTQIKFAKAISCPSLV